MLRLDDWLDFEELGRDRSLLVEHPIIYKFDPHYWSVRSPQTGSLRDGHEGVPHVKDCETATRESVMIECGFDDLHQVVASTPLRSFHFVK